MILLKALMVTLPLAIVTVIMTLPADIWFANPF